MMDYTDRHFRYLLRLISKHALLYTEMITADAIMRGDHKRLLRYNPEEHPIVLQLGGSDPLSLSAAARIAQDLGYDQINLNVGCPSDRVQNGRFGACLMKEPELVADCIAEMQAVVSIPVTVKTRIGVDDKDSYEYLFDFIAKVSSAGCQSFIIHARKAWLKGLSPKENRTLPPLRYEVVHQLKKDFSQLCIVLNGGVQTMDQVEEHLAKVDGVMIGRQVCQDPYFLAHMDRLYYGEETLVASREEVLMKYVRYMREQMVEGVAVTA
ncbi:MAG: dusA, partial [Gammaproteobacteria bacterium]|nr:dusA [Gammaproteobacteria bacterium]